MRTAGRTGMRRGALGLLIGLGVVLGACAKPAPPLAEHPPMGGRETLDAVAENMGRLRSVRGTADVTFTRPDGDSVRLDAAVAAVPPDRFRVQAWKFGRLVMDVTSVRGEVWVFSDRGGDGAAGEADGGLPEHAAAKVAWSLAPLTRGFWERAVPLEEWSTPDVLVARSSAEDGDALMCSVDRRTLTPVRFERFSHGTTSGAGAGSAGAGASFELDRYREVNGVLWPTLWRFASAKGAVEIRMGDVELNAPVEDGAFVPPRRAVKLP